ncbi:MAG TPA: SPOR domain-containing protein, partial [Cyclobacteriaceae bacterium]|nr:SPOR domain-containing protein [Cyclobacteriaceae bacterium]
MKSTLRNVFFLMALFAGSTAYSQHYYVVIGAFARETNAKKFTGFARNQFFQAAYEKKPNSRLYYVYVTKTNVKKDAFAQARILQKESTFQDAWVYTGSLIEVVPPQPTLQPKPQPVEPVITEPVVVDSVAEIETDTLIASDTVEKVLVLPVDTTSTIALTPDVNASALPPATKAKGKYFRFALVGPDGQPFRGKIHNVNLRLGRDLASYNSYDYNDILLPSSQRDEPMTFICGIFGYKEVMQLVDYTNPALTEGVT